MYKSVCESGKCCKGLEESVGLYVSIHPSILHLPPMLLPAVCECKLSFMPLPSGCQNVFTNRILKNLVMLILLICRVKHRSGQAEERGEKKLSIKSVVHCL